MAKIADYSLERSNPVAYLRQSPETCRLVCSPRSTAPAVSEFLGLCQHTGAEPQGGVIHASKCSPPAVGAPVCHQCDNLACTGDKLTNPCKYNRRQLSRHLAFLH